MPDTTIRLRYPTGATVYAQINSDVTIWDGTAYVAKVLADWATYATAMPETPAGFGEYVCEFPAASPTGNYSWAVFQQAGGTPASLDVCIGTGGGYWDGTTFGGAASVTGDVGGNLAGSVGSVAGGVFVANLPDPPPLGYGPVGTGSVAVNQDYPTPGNLSFRASPGGPGIAGAAVRAYLASDYLTNPNGTPIRGQTVTLDSGAWANNILLDPDDYIIVFTASGYEDTFVELTVS